MNAKKHAEVDRLQHLAARAALPAFDGLSAERPELPVEREPAALELLEPRVARNSGEFS